MFSRYVGLMHIMLVYFRHYFRFERSIIPRTSVGASSYDVDKKLYAAVKRRLNHSLNTICD